MLIRYVKPSGFLVIVLFCLNIVPAIYILVCKYYVNWFDESITGEQYERGAFEYLKTSFLFFFTLISTLFFFSTKHIFSKVYIIEKYKSKDLNQDRSAQKTTIDSLINALAWLCCLIILIYFFSGGYVKLSLLGGSVRGMAFRLIGNGDDVNHILVALLEIVRSVFMPFCCVYLMTHQHIIGKKKKKTIYAFLSLLLFAGLMTLDRYPILIFLCLILYVYFTQTLNIKHNLVVLSFGFVSIVVVSGFLKFVQVNWTDIAYRDTLSNSVNFLWKRAFIEPSVASVEFSFCTFPAESDKLYLKYSRLGALVGRPYVGTSDVNAKYVAPVGAIGDCWRNFGLIGCLCFAVILGCVFSFLDKTLPRIDIAAKIAISFMSILFVFSLIYGNIFSQKNLLQFSFLPLVSQFFKNTLKFR
jgi:hypothetical protein